MTGPEAATAEAALSQYLPFVRSSQITRLCERGRAAPFHAPASVSRPRRRPLLLRTSGCSRDLLFLYPTPSLWIVRCQALLLSDELRLDEVLCVEYLTAAFEEVRSALGTL
jgi:hypothetical protein